MSKDFSKGAAFVGGEFVPISEAKISVLDWGFTRSDVVYDVVSVVNGGFFRLNDHLDRFARSMSKRHLNVGMNREDIRQNLHKVVALSGLRDSYVAMVASRGRPQWGSRRPADCANHLITYALPWIDVIPKEVCARGAKLFIASSHPRVPDASVDPTIKNYQWSDLTSGLLEAHEQDFDTSVTADAQGFITEGPGFNIFAVKDGKVITSDHGALHGITRKTVLELCQRLGIACAAQALPRAILENADEAFAATTAGGLMRIRQVGSRVLPQSDSGPIFFKLEKAFWDAHQEAAFYEAVRY